MPFRPPTWLESFDPYNEYLRAGAAGTLRLPEYRRDGNGDIVVYPGEAFCRMPHCDRSRIPQETRNLRTHVKSHGVQVAQAPTGRISTEEKDDVRGFYQDLISNQRVVSPQTTMKVES